MWRTDILKISLILLAHPLLTMHLHCKEKQCRVTFPPRWPRLHQRWRAGRSTCGDKSICPPVLPSDMHAATLHCSPSQMHLTAGGIIRSTHISQSALLPRPAECALVTSHCCNTLLTRTNPTRREHFGIVAWLKSEENLKVAVMLSWVIVPAQVPMKEGLMG